MFANRYFVWSFGYLPSRNASSICCLVKFLMPVSSLVRLALLRQLPLLFTKQSVPEKAAPPCGVWHPAQPSTFLARYSPRRTAGSVAPPAPPALLPPAAPPALPPALPPWPPAAPPAACPAPPPAPALPPGARPVPPNRRCPSCRPNHRRKPTTSRRHSTAPPVPPSIVTSVTPLISIVD